MQVNVSCCSCKPFLPRIRLFLFNVLNHKTFIALKSYDKWENLAIVCFDFLDVVPWYLSIFYSCNVLEGIYVDCWDAETKFMSVKAYSFIQACIFTSSRESNFSSKLAWVEDEFYRFEYDKEWGGRQKELGLVVKRGVQGGIFSRNQSDFMREINGNNGREINGNSDFCSQKKKKKLRDEYFRGRHHLGTFDYES